LASLFLCVAATAQSTGPGSLLTGGTSSTETQPGVGIPYAYATVASKAHGEQARYDLGGDGNRVLLNTGSFVHQVTDAWVPGRGLDFEWTRIYRSDTRINGPMGVGWHHGYDQYLVLYRATGASQSDLIAFRDGFGRGYAFRQVTPSIWEGPTNLFVRMYKLDAGTFQLTLRNGEKRFFRAPTPSQVGRLLRIEDPAGNALSFAYTAD